MKISGGVTALAVVAISLSACGSDKVSTAAATTPKAGSVATSQPSDETTTPAVVGSNPGSDFCKAVAATKETSAAISKQMTATPIDPAALRRAYASFDVAIAAMSGAAPDEISADMATVSGAFTAFEAVLTEVDFDLVKANAAEFTGKLKSIQTPEYTAAGDRIDALTTKECGITVGGD